MGPVELHTHTWGDGPRRALLLHGISSAGAGWWRVAASLVEAGWSVTAPDLRGHGLSPRTSSYTFAEYAADVRRLGGGWDVVVGHSMGGTVAVLVLDEDPGFARSAILQDPAIVVAGPPEETLAWLTPDFEGPMTPSWVLEQSPRYHQRDAELKAQALRQTSVEVVRATVLDNPAWNVLEQAAALTVPTVILGSDPESGGIMPVALGEWLASTNGFVEYRMIPGSGHSCHREDDDYPVFAATLMEALERLGEREGT